MKLSPLHQSWLVVLQSALPWFGNCRKVSDHSADSLLPLGRSTICSSMRPLLLQLRGTCGRFRYVRPLWLQLRGTCGRFCSVGLVASTTWDLCRFSYVSATWDLGRLSWSPLLRGITWDLCTFRYVGSRSPPLRGIFVLSLRGTTLSLHRLRYVHLFQTSLA